MDTLFSDTDSESFTENGGDDLEEIDSAYGGKARSILSSLEESIGKIDDFLSFERGFTHGDIVCSVADPSGQTGRVENVEMIVDLKNIFGRVIKDVNSEKLIKMRSISAGDYVVYGPWLGRVDKVIDCVTILFDDGSKCEIMATDEEKIVPLSPSLIEDSLYNYYPGQRVQVRLPTLSESARWLCGTRKENCDDGTISSVEAGLVNVEWFASAQLGGASGVSMPSYTQDPKNLTLLSWFSHANWQLGDWCILPVHEGKGRMDRVMFKRNTASSYLEEVFVIGKTKYKVDVIWQNGSYSLGLDSQSLIPKNILDAHEFWPGQFVIEKTCDDLNGASRKNWGVVSSVDPKDKTVKVKWVYLLGEKPTNLEGNQNEEIVGAYELVAHPDYSYSFGEFVLSATLCDGQCDADTYIDLVGPEMGLSGASSPINQFLSNIGNVTGFKDGCVEVKWATGLTTKVAPCKVLTIDKFEELVTSSSHHQENVDYLNETLIGHEKQSSAHEGNDLFCHGVREDGKRPLCEYNAFALPGAAISYLTNIAVNLFGSFGSTSVPDSVSSGDQFMNLVVNNESGPCKLCTEIEPLIDGDLHTSKVKISKQEDLETVTDEHMSVLSIGNQGPFRQFDMVTDCLDHHFFEDAGKGSAKSQVKREWLKKVQQEWGILEKDLPESIYVRIYEERMDLMRAAIVGAPGTPYHDGLFLFDICLPPEYPLQPPLVHYHSRGLRLNPNLYESGRVCLSLLNTWSGRGSEVWNPGSSTILQVLLSLQALVLNERPYFNEAGYDAQMGETEGEKNAVSYNENAFLITWTSMVYILRKPPKHFEGLVKEHFSQRSHSILTACKSYMNALPFGWGSNIGQSEEESKKASSAGFKIMLSKLLPKLVDAFSSHGIDCNRFMEPEK